MTEPITKRTRRSVPRPGNGATGYQGQGRKDCYRLTCTLGGNTFMFEVKRKAEVEPVKRFAELLGYTVTVEKSTKAIIL